MDNKEIEAPENYDYIYKDYFETVKGDTDDLIFAPMKDEKRESEK